MILIKIYITVANVANFVANNFSTGNTYNAQIHTVIWFVANVANKYSKINKGMFRQIYRCIYIYFLPNTLFYNI